MKKIAIIASIAVLSACGQSAEEAPTAPETAAAAEETAAAAVTANGSPAGTYTVVGPDGTTGTSVLNADGTFQDLDAAGKVTGEGTWAVVGGKTCFTPKGDEQECWTESAPGADGSFTATSDEGASITIKPAAPAAAG